QNKDLNGRFLEARPRFMEALVAFLDSQGKAVYPDANGTLRVTVGTVAGSAPRDGMRYLPFTTLAGVVDKDTGVKPFDTPPSLLEAMRRGDSGRWADEGLGSVPVNFL
ncbi:MAG: S46 family peptidase, partial [Xanthomonadales bacterium]|nr:S46 family peptidase [Xanthomonadales bacterium]NIX11704.1 S46 family peptidase [Xanthomonadales bacterium]